MKNSMGRFARSTGILGAGFLCVVAAGAAHGQEAQNAPYAENPSYTENPRPWTLSASFDSSFSAGDSETFSGTQSLGGTLGLSRDFGVVIVGASAGLARRDVEIPDAFTLEGAESFSVGGFIAFPLGGGFDAVLSIDHATETYDTSTPNEAGTGLIGLDGDTGFFGAGATLSRAFGARTRAIPYVSLMWNRVDAEIIVDFVSPAVPNLVFESTEEGLSGSAGLTLAHDAAPRVSIYGTAGLVAAANEAATWRASYGSRTDGGPVNGGDDEAAVWAELGAGIAVLAAPGTVLSLDISGTAGSESDAVATSLTASFSF